MCLSCGGLLWFFFLVVLCLVCAICMLCLCFYYFVHLKLVGFVCSYYFFHFVVVFFLAYVFFCITVRRPTRSPLSRSLLLYSCMFDYCCICLAYASCFYFFVSDTYCFRSVFFFLMIRLPLTSTFFPYMTLFRSLTGTHF